MRKTIRIKTFVEFLLIVLVFSLIGVINKQNQEIQTLDSKLNNPTYITNQYLAICQKELTSVPPNLEGLKD